MIDSTAGKRKERTELVDIILVFSMKLVHLTTEPSMSRGIECRRCNHFLLLLFKEHVFVKDPPMTTKRRNPSSTTGNPAKSDDEVSPGGTDQKLNPSPTDRSNGKAKQKE